MTASSAILGFGLAMLAHAESVDVAGLTNTSVHQFITLFDNNFPLIAVFAISFGVAMWLYHKAKRPGKA